jgi:hypothetical protein
MPVLFLPEHVKFLKLNENRTKVAFFREVPATSHFGHGDIALPMGYEFPRRFLSSYLHEFHLLLSY